MKLKTTAHKSWSVGFSIDVVSSVASGRADSTLSNRCVCYSRPSSNGSLLVFASTARHSLPPCLAAREGLGWSVVGGANRSEALGEATLRGSVAPGEPELYPFAVLNGTQLYPRFWQIGGGGGGGPPISGKSGVGVGVGIGGSVPCHRGWEGPWGWTPDCRHVPSS